jgi:ABC-type nitrate/sulfonate/bicarbonate transport system ATPase subunit
MTDQLAVGQIRPMSFRVSNRVKHVVHDRVNQVEGLSVMSLGRSGSGYSKLIRIVLNTDKPVPAAVIEDIRADVKAVMGKKTPVLIGVFQNAVISPTQLPTNKSTQINNPD